MGWDTGASGLLQVLPEAEVEEARRSGVAADVCGIMMDDQGRLVATDLFARLITAAPEDLRQIPLRLAVVSGPRKAAGVLAAVKAGLINAVVTDAATARRILSTTAIKVAKLNRAPSARMMPECRWRMPGQHGPPRRDDCASTTRARRARSPRRGR